METVYEPTPEDFYFTEEEQWEMAMRGVIEYEDEKRQQAINELFKRNSLDDEFLELPWYKRIFYWFKCFICLGLERTNGSYLVDTVAMVNWNGRSGGPEGCYYWDCVWVEMGVFKGWRVCVSSDST